MTFKDKKESPTRLVTSMSEGDDRLDLVRALVDYVVNDPYGACSVLTETRTNPGEGGDIHAVQVTLANTVRQTCTVDGILERLNMHDWRTFCDKFLCDAHRRVGIDPENCDWPIPVPHVTFVPEEDGTDLIRTVKVWWETDEGTHSVVRNFVGSRPAVLDVTCVDCDFDFKCHVAPGQDVMVCPVCGTVQPICENCEDHSKCPGCEAKAACEAIMRRKAEVVR